MSVSVDVAWKSLNKYQEELCGDKVEVLKTDKADVLILADGMGKRCESEHTCNTHFKNPKDNVSGWGFH